jgi:hypothetical protein
MSFNLTTTYRINFGESLASASIENSLQTQTHQGLQGFSISVFIVCFFVVYLTTLLDYDEFEKLKISL